MMRKSLILASFLFASSAFSDCLHVSLVGSTYSQITGMGTIEQVNAYILGQTMIFDCVDSGSFCSCTTTKGYASGTDSAVITDWSYYGDSNLCPAGTTQTNSICVPNDQGCSAGFNFSSDAGGCIPNDQGCSAGFNFSSDAGGCIPNSPPAIDPNADPMNAHNNDPAGCDAAGGYYFADGSCNGGSQALAKMFQDPLATVGAMLTLGGVTFSGAGILASAALGATPVGAVTVGVLATVAGVGSLVAAGGSLLDWTTTPSNDVTSGTTRIKVNLTTAGGSTGTISGTNVTQADTVTGKVSSNTFVPATVKTAMETPANVNKTTGALIAPISLSGVRVTNYNYTTKVATTVTHSPTSTSATPVTTQVTSAFAVSQNYDGTTTATATTQTNAPTVSGSAGGFVVSSGGGTAGTVSDAGTGTGTGGSTGTGPDYTGVLNDIKKNTGDSAGFLSSINDSLSAGGNANDVLTDGSDSFGTHDGTIKGSMNGFVYTDPLGLNTLGGTGGIQSYGFTLYGRHFVVLDQSMIDQLPIALMKNLFLFIAAVLGLITVVSGV